MHKLYMKDILFLYLTAKDSYYIWEELARVR